MNRVCVRGIYSTALTKLFLDGGFEVVQPSTEIMGRFGLSYKPLFPDITVESRQDRQGVWIIGSPEAMEATISLLRERLPDVIVRRNESLSGSSIFLDVEFPAASKEKLDEVRGEVLPTLKGHHYYRACGSTIEQCLEMAEKLLQKGQPRDEVNRIFRETVFRSYPYEGSYIGFTHVKLSGKTYNLGNALIEAVDYDLGEIRVSRVIRSQGVYDGLDMPREAGDKAVTEAKIGEWYVRTSYFSKNGEYKGTYVNLNTPVEVYPSEIRYVDLEVDVCFLSGGEVKVLDEDKLLNAVERGIISEKLARLVIEKAYEISKKHIM